MTEPTVQDIIDNEQSQQKLIISKIEVLRSVLTAAIPIYEEHPTAETTRYKAAIDPGNRDIIVDKIMFLIDQL